MTRKLNFSFLYDGRSPFDGLATEIVAREGDTVTTCFDLGRGVKVRNVCRYYPDYDAYEWVNYFENTGNTPSGVFSEIADGDVTLPFPENPPLRWTAYLPSPDDSLLLYAPKGSVWSCDEFSAVPEDAIASNRYQHLLFPGETKTYATSGGRSSEAHAPFFYLHLRDRGYVVAVGWTGQWNASFTRNDGGVAVKTGIENARFYLRPGESFRTSSVVYMPYSGTRNDGVNRWRRFVKTYFSPIKSPAELPFCAGVWGGMSTDGILRRIAIIKKEKLPFTHLWMDAGWYGSGKAPSPDEYEGDWALHTGEWEVNETYHPDGLTKVRDAAKDAGLRFLLWFEPERVIGGTPITLSHPEYFLGKNEAGKNMLLNLGNPDAWQYVYDMLTEKIETLGISVYRQDFNMSPLSYWRDNDTEDRAGITEILHINGLYRLWDALRTRFPGLLIDNCASGGRRIDIETLRRSIPLWRSDAQCPANFPVRLTQMHSVSFGEFMPYSGTGPGRAYDIYRFRSSYAPAFTTNYTFSEKDTFGDDAEKIAWLRRYGEEYLRVRPYLSEDIHPLTRPAYEKDIWSSVAYHKPDTDSGVILCYRREESPYTTAVFPMPWLNFANTYVFRDEDTGNTVEYSGKYLTENGFPVEMPEKYSAKVIFYSAVSSHVCH